MYVISVVNDAALHCRSIFCNSKIYTVVHAKPFDYLFDVLFPTIQINIFGETI